MQDKAIVEFKQEGPITVGRILTASVLDARNVDQFVEELLDYVKGHPGIHLVLDFGRVTYFSSAVLGGLVRALKAVATDNGSMRLCGLAPMIRELFEITNLDKAFIIEKDVKTALTRFERSLQVTAEDEAWQKSRKGRES